jgi:hypothetical protein
MAPDDFLQHRVTPSARSGATFTRFAVLIAVVHVPGGR